MVILETLEMSRTDVMYTVTCHNIMSRVTQGEEMADWGLGICCGPLVVCQTAAEHEERNNPRN